RCDAGEHPDLPGRPRGHRAAAASLRAGPAEDPRHRLPAAGAARLADHLCRRAAPRRGPDSPRWRHMTAQSVTPPRILVLWASESATNLGVAALARGSRDLLQRVSPGAEITFANYGARPAQVPWGRPRSLVRERVQSRLGMQDYFRGFDLVWDTRAGDSFAGIYGLGRLVSMSMVHECVRAAGTPIVMAPQTIGPFTTRRSRLLARWNLRRSRLVVARDPRSAAEAEALRRPADMTAAEVVVAIEPPAAGPPRGVLLYLFGVIATTYLHVTDVASRRILQE